MDWSSVWDCDIFRAYSLTFWSIKISGELLNKEKTKGFLESTVSIYGISTLFTTLSHNQIKETLAELIEQTSI